jgi:hypothetical protein
MVARAPDAEPAAVKGNRNGAGAQPPPVFAARADQRDDWLPETPLDWLEEYRHKHIERCHGWQESVDQIRQIQDRAAAEQAKFRANVRRAFAAGEPLPEAPAEAQPLVVAEIVRAARADAREDADALGAIVVETLAALRQRRAEIEPYTHLCSRELLAAIDQAPGGSTALRAAALRRELAELEAATQRKGAT